MKSAWRPVFAAMAAVIATACAGGPVKNQPNDVRQAASGAAVATGKIVKSEAEWRAQLSPEAYRILREQGTERPFSGKYDHIFDAGMYVCAGCGNELFRSDAKFNSGCGWPAFFEAARKDSLLYIEDRSHNMVRTEVRCGRCDGHLGHVFNDGPKPTGLRFCINSGAIELKKTP